jgi:hypothetical protein
MKMKEGKLHSSLQLPILHNLNLSHPLHQLLFPPPKTLCLLKRILMFGHTPLPTPRTHGIDPRLEDFFLSAVGARSEFDEGVQGDVQPGGTLLVVFHEVGVDAAEDGLVRYYEDIFAAFEFHDDGFETDYDVAVTGEGVSVFDIYWMVLWGGGGRDKRRVSSVGTGNEEEGERKVRKLGKRMRDEGTSTSEIT